MYRYEIIENNSRSYDLHVYFDKTDAEFAHDFLSYNKKDAKARRNFFLSIQEKAAGLPIKTVKIFVAGVLVATLSMQAVSAAAAQADGFTPRFLSTQQQLSALQTKFHMTYLYGGTVSQQIEQIKQVGSFQTVSPSYFDLNSSGELVLNNVNASFIDAMHTMGIKVVPMLSNHWNRASGEAALANPEKLAQSIADAIIANNLDGVNVDIENVTHTHRSAYTELVRLLRQKLPAEKEVSVAVAANPNGWTTGWHGSYDYAELAKYADYLMVMAYDESWEGSSAGPVASYSFVKRSIEYALEHTTADKLVIGVPFYGRIWSSDGTFNGNGVSLNTIQTLIQQYNGTITYDTSSRSPKAQFTVNAGDTLLSIGGKRLTHGSYTVWFEDETSIYEKTRLIHQYDLKGMGSWSLTQATDGIRTKLTEWLTESNITPTPQTPVIGIVTANSLRVRKSPTTDSETIAYYQKDDTVTIIGKSGSFYEIQMANGQIGYVSAAYITISEEQPTTPATKTGYSTGDRVRVRASASTSSAILTHVNRGDSFTVSGDVQNGWYEVTLKDGTKGFISADYVSFTAPTTPVTKTGYSTGDRVRVRASASTSSAILTHVNRGDSFTVSGDAQNVWYEVTLKDGTKGFIHADYVSFTAPTPPTTKTAYSTGDRVRVRASASTSSAILTHVNRGDSFTVSGNVQNGWYEVTLKDGIKGFIHADYVSFTSPAPTSKTGYSTGDRVRIRASASTSSAVLAYVNRGDSFTILGNKQNGWYKVTLKSGTTGYIYADYVTF